MEIQFKNAFRFNLNSYQVESIIITEHDEETLEENEYTFKDYLDELITIVVEDNRSKRFLFPTDDSAIKTIISGVINGDREASTLSAARRLLRTEQNVQGRMEHLSIEVQKGIMIQALVRNNDQNLYIIIKAEHADFINERDNKKTTGLPIKKKIFKSFCAYLDENNLPIFAMVSDNRSTISAYWWLDFLELVKELTDEQNTENAFEALETKIFNKIKINHLEDYQSLRNATVSYFRSNQEFVLEDYLGDIITPYQAVDPNLNMITWAGKIRELPENQNFEPRFIIIKEKIKKRMIKTLNLNPQLTLVIRDEVTPNTVNGILVDGVKYLRIRSELGYDQFPKL